MAKNKIVFMSERGARVMICDNVEDIPVIEGEVRLVNPDTSFVNDFPPEFWTLDEKNLLVPLTEEAQIKKRMADLGVKAFIRDTDTKIKENLSSLVDIPHTVESYRREVADMHHTLAESIDLSDLKTADMLDGARYDIITKLRSSMNHSHELLMMEFERLEKDARHSEKVFYAFFALTFILLGVILYFVNK